MGIEDAIIEIKNQDLSAEMAILDELWVDIGEKLLKQDIPKWHADILAERLEKIQAGKAKFEDWETVKQRILNGKKD